MQNIYMAVIGDDEKLDQIIVSLKRRNSAIVALVFFFKY